MEPSLKAILEGYRGDIEVIAQALKAEILLFFHGLNVLGTALPFVLHLSYAIETADRRIENLTVTNVE